MREFFARLDENPKLLENFEKILIFSDENPIEKLNFLFFSKFVSKNRAFGNSTIFLQHFFRFRGGGEFPPFPPGYALGTGAFQESLHSPNNNIFPI